MNQNIYKNICAKYQVDTCSEEACRGVFQKTALLKNPIYDSIVLIYITLTLLRGVPCISATTTPHIMLRK